MGAGRGPNPNGGPEGKGTGVGAPSRPPPLSSQGGLRARLGQNGETTSGKPPDLTVRRSMVNFL